MCCADQSMCCADHSMRCADQSMRYADQSMWNIPGASKCIVYLSLFIHFAPPTNSSPFLIGAGGGYMERDGVEYVARQKDSDDEYDDVS